MPRLRVLTGPSTTSIEDLEDISHLVNTSTPHRIQSDVFDGEVVVHILDFVGPCAGGASSASSASSNDYGHGNGNGNGNGGGGGRGRGDAYFCSTERKGVTWSIQVRCVNFFLILWEGTYN